MVIHQSDELLNGMGRVEYCHPSAAPAHPTRESKLTGAEVEQCLLGHVRMDTREIHAHVRQSYPSATAVVKYMPRLEAYFTYRNLDVSTLKGSAKRWNPPSPKRIKRGSHKVLTTSPTEEMLAIASISSNFLPIPPSENRFYTVQTARSASFIHENHQIYLRFLARSTGT